VTCNVTHVAARDWIRNRFEELGYTVSVQRSEDAGYDVVNLVAEVPGTGDGVLIVGAHYDAGFAAADDDTTGVAVVLELARLLQGSTPERTLRLVTFDLEELGLLGSAAYVGANALDDVVAMINVDGVGVSSPEQPDVLFFPDQSAGDFVLAGGNRQADELVATATLLGNDLGIVPVVPVVVGGDGTGALGGLFRLASSDHASFWADGIPAVAFSDTQPTRDPAYHSADDTVEHLDPQFLERATQLIAATTAYLGEVAP
jgi:Zn-dependent M28 family amino/carboxypeptidase